MYVVKNKNNSLVFCTQIDEPIRSTMLECWFYNKKNSAVRLNNNLFPDLTWEDEPLEVEIISKKELEELRYKASQAPTIPYMGE